MIILNTSFHVHVSLDSRFREWVRTSYIRSALKSGLLKSPRFASIMIEVQEGCLSYAVSFEAETIEKAVEWHDGEGAALRSELHKHFGEGVVFFTTYMEELPID